MSEAAQCLITVSLGLVRTLNLDSNVFSLFVGKLGELDTKGRQVKISDLLVEVLGQDVDVSSLVLVGVLFLPELDLGQNLVGKRARHDERRVASGATQVEKTTFGQDNDAVSRGEDKLVNLGLDVDALGGLHQTFHVEFVVKVTNVSDNGVVLHLGHVFGHDNSLVTSSGDENVTSGDDIGQSENLVTFHGGLEGTNGVDFGHIDDATTGTHGSGATLADITVSANDGLLTSKHDISGTHDTVGKRVLAPVKVVELGLGDRVVDVDGSEKKGSSLFHHVETVNTGGGFLGDTLAASGNLVPLVGLTSFQETLDDGKNNLEFGIVRRAGVRKSAVLQEKVFGLLTLVDEESHVATVVDDKVGTVTLAVVCGPGDGVQGALPILLEGFSLPGKDSSGLVTSDGSGSMVLGGENVARAPADISTEFLESLDQDGRLDGHVKTSRDTGSSERLGGTVFGTASHKSRHLDFGEFNILATVVSEGNVGNWQHW